MRGFRLARVAAQAELLRFRCLLRRQVIRMVLALCAGIFLFGAVAWLHVAGAIALTGRVSPVQAALIVAVVDAVIATILGILAARDVPGPVELEALRVRRLAVDNAVETVVLATLVSRLSRVRSVRDLLGVALAAVVALFVGARR